MPVYLLDAVIAALALQVAAALVTIHLHHFPMPELPVFAADEDGLITLVSR